MEQLIIFMCDLHKIAIYSFLRSIHMNQYVLFLLGIVQLHLASHWLETCITFNFDEPRLIMALHVWGRCTSVVFVDFLVGYQKVYFSCFCHAGVCTSWVASHWWPASVPCWAKLLFFELSALLTISRCVVPAWRALVARITSFIYAIVTLVISNKIVSLSMRAALRASLLLHHLQLELGLDLLSSFLYKFFGQFFVLLLNSVASVLDLNDILPHKFKLILIVVVFKFASFTLSIQLNILFLQHLDLVLLCPKFQIDCLHNRFLLCQFGFNLSVFVPQSSIFIIKVIYFLN